MSRSSLTNDDISDRELLFIIDDLALEGGEWRGWTRSEDIADRLGITAKFPNQAVGSRCSWLKRYGAVTNPKTASGYWKPTPVGRGLMSGELSVELVQALDDLGGAEAILLARYVGKRQRVAPKTAGHMIRREWTRETKRRTR